MINFKNIKYLKEGNNRQQIAFNELIELNILKDLSKYNPVLAGTIPIEIDLPESDLDIICECKNHKFFSKKIIYLYGDKNNFKISLKQFNGIKSTVASFTGKSFKIEIFGQSIPIEKQNAYRHMIIEYKLLKEKGIKFKNEIIKLKKSGLKTEPAFAKLLGISGNPYIELLKL